MPATHPGQPPPRPRHEYILAIIEHANRIRILGTTAHPTAGSVAQAIKNLVMDLEDAGCRTRYLITDQNGKFPTGRCCLSDRWARQDTDVQWLPAGVRDGLDEPQHLMMLPRRYATPTL